MSAKRSIFSGSVAVLAGLYPVLLPLQSIAASTVGARPLQLTCDSLINPVGIDDRQPMFSWQLQDAGMGAKQTAYQIQVSTQAAAGKADVWDSGRITSGQSQNVAYAGPELAPEKRYFWRVTVWGKDGQAYPVSDAAWWETGLLTPENWKGKWIGYLDTEERLVREANSPWIWNAGEDALKQARKGKHDFRFSFTLQKPVKTAVLFVTGKDLSAAWVNGKEALAAGSMPPWKQTSWGTYRRKEVTSDLQQGRNSLAVEVTFAAANAREAYASMNATLLVEAQDGSYEVFKAGPEWKATFEAPQGWTAAEFQDNGWQNAVVTAETGDPQLGRPWPTGPVKLLRRTFDAKGPIVSARLYATALGAYELRLNGSKVGDQILSPGWTDYRQHVPYQVYDVTSQIRPGKNALGAYLAPGWYSTPLMWFRQGNNYGKTPPALRAQLRLQHKDGSVDWVVTDDAWQADVSPITQAEIYDGETFDARHLQQGWDTAAFTAPSWKPAIIVTPDEPKIEAQTFQPIREKQVLSSKKITSPKPGVYIYDFGQNLAGVARLRIQGKPGTAIQLRFAEDLNPDGTVYVENLRTAKATDRFILAGSGAEEFQPRFTFHGFRYVELTGADSKPDISTVKAVVIHTDAPLTARLQTGSPLINQLWSNIQWGQRSNFVGVPTDCPQRDERLGWTADAQVFWRTATYNMDLGAFSRKFSADLRGTQTGTEMYGIFAPGVTTPNPGFGPGWSDAGVIIPWTAWIQYGDPQVAAQNWNAMEKYLKTIKDANPDYLWTKNIGIPFGDWLAPEEKTSINLIASAYWAYDVSLMRQMAHALARNSDEEKYAELFDKIKAAFQKAYVRSDGTVDGGTVTENAFPGIDTTPKPSATPGSQTGYVLALNMHLVPDDLRQRASEKLLAKLEANRWLLGTGFLGTPYLLAALTDTGHSDVAYRLLLNKEYPSWGYLVDHGATTMWERWNGDQMRGDPSMNSYNHYAYGAVADWIYRYAAGIDVVPGDPGYHTIYLHPNFDSRLGSLDFSYASPYGEIKSVWSTNGTTAKWTVTIPPNTTATLPVENDKFSQVMLNGVEIGASPAAHLVKKTDGVNTYELPAGMFVFSFTRKQPASAL